MTDYNSYPSLLQTSQMEFIKKEPVDIGINQMSNNSNNGLMYNSAPLILLNSQKPDTALFQNSMMNDGQTYVTIQTQAASGANDLNGAKILNTPIIIQSSQIPLQTSQYQQQPPTTINVAQNQTQMTSLTPSQLQSLSYLMQTQMTPQFIQTTNGLIQIIPQGFITTQQQQNQSQNHDHSLQAQITGLPTLGWSLGNFSSNNNQITMDNQPLHLNNLSLPQLIPVQHLFQSQNSFFGQQDNDQSELVSTIVDLNANDKKPACGDKKNSRRKRKPTSLDSSQMSSPSGQPTSTNEVAREAAESSSGGPMHGVESGAQFDNKGRPFSFLCPDCPKRFTLNSRLSAHMRCHTGMRPYTCSACGFSFTQKSYLIRHAAVHKEERPFHCERCQKSYKHYGSLANHRKLHRKDGRLDVDLGPLLELDPHQDHPRQDHHLQDHHLQAKVEPSDNGRSSSLSSLAINHGYDHAALADLISSTTNDSGGYVKQLGVHSDDCLSAFFRDQPLLDSADLFEHAPRGGYLVPSGAGTDYDI